jgi:hypothetical protein
MEDFMKRESLVTNTEKLLFDILETKKEMLKTLKRIEDNTYPLPFIEAVKVDVEESSTDVKKNEKVNEKTKKVNVKKGAKK